jgi:Tfp pilus assembly protein PilE
MATVIVGVLAAATVPAFANPRAHANSTKVRADLARYARAQDAYFGVHGRYASSLDQLALRASEGVLLTPVEGTADGWSVRAVHPSAAPGTCALHHGSAAPVAPATAPGVIACR